MKNINKGYSFMAFSKGKESTEGDFKRYIGVGSVFVLGVSPNKETLEKLYERDFENDPEYIKEVEIGEGDNKHTVLQAKVEFIAKFDPASKTNNGIEDIVRIPITLRKEYRYNRDKTKVQVIDNYGRTAWVTEEELKNHSTTLQKKDGGTYEANIDKDYRPAYIGEENLVKFLIAYLNIPSTVKRNSDGTFSSKTGKELEECAAGIEDISKIFKGDFSEIREAIALQPNNKLKAVFGVRTVDGRQFQAVYDTFMKNSINDYSRIDAELKQANEEGRYTDTEFSIRNLSLYEVTPTDLNNPSNSASTPFPPQDNTNPWFNN